MDAGLDEPPLYDFGTQVMVVQDPRPRDDLLPRAYPAKIFGPDSTIPRGYWVYQKGFTMVKVNIQPKGMDPPDLQWVKVSQDHWEAPDRVHSEEEDCE